VCVCVGGGGVEVARVWGGGDSEREAEACGGGGGSGEEDGLAIYGEDPRSPGRRASRSAQTLAADPRALRPSRSRYGSTGKGGL
jgi:hypothetical protein